MELTTTESDSNSKPPSSNHRSILTIDLNETPSSSETLPSPSSSSAAAAVANAASSLSPISVVRYFHDNPLPAEGPAADIPGEGRLSDCGACGRPEVRGHVVVCDGCERGFHFGCAGMRGRQAALLEEWVCGECLSAGIGSRRWPLGRKHAARCEVARPLFDINASPPSDEDGGGVLMVAAGVNGQESEEVSLVRDSRKYTLDDNTFGGYPIGVPLSRPNIMPSTNGFGFRNASVKHTVRLDLEDILHHRQSIGRTVDEVKLDPQSGRRRSSSSATIRLPSWDPSEIFLQSLREFITERHGVLQEGWHVEFKPSKSSCELCAVYCSPDGRIFETMSDVACYLGIVPNGISLESEVTSTDGSAALQKGSHVQKRRKLSRVPAVNGFSENKGSVMTVFGKELSFNMRSADFNASLEVMEPGKDGCTDFQQFNDGLPVQYEDFFILSLGKIDVRPTYHNVSHIWPVGYRSCWHDKVTGSLFLCDVVDDGDDGPIFKVRRFSCSSLPIPYGSTILYRQSIGKPEDLKEKQNGETCSNMTCDDDCSIDLILSDHCLPVDDGLLSWLASSSDEACDVKFGGNSQVEIIPRCPGSKNSSNELSFVGDKIGEFSVDGRASSLVWSILSQRLTDACRQIYKQTGYIKFLCKHVGDEASSLCCDLANEKSGSKFSSMDKFCSLLGAINIPSIVKSDHEFELVAELLKNWMNLDRFGLEMEFVQEIIEQLPAIHGCSQYQFLKSRDSRSTSPMVGNGLLLVNAKTEVTELHGKQANGLNDKANRKGVTGMIENPLKDDHIPPPGTIVGSKLPPHLVGNVLQVWEILWRFHDILGLAMDFNFDQLEAELISPWYESTCAQEKSERDCHENQVAFSSVSRYLSGQTSSSSSEIDRNKDNSQIYIEMETLATKEAACARLASSTYSRCTGVVLRKVHMSLLNVIVSELQSKVAALVEPTLDGESKPRRGRKRDIDSSNLARRSRFSMLPINELTWPELARRYLLAVLCVDGNLDCAEATARESGKIFRCLQGDGGLLCGSLSGVAGIEADALLLAEAMKRIYGSSNRKKDILIMEDQEPESTVASERMLISDGGIPEWAKALEPVRKLPTNVGTRIRRCVYEALEKGPPDWARKILEHSISKEVYKGNASGPTKKAVLAVLADVQCCSLQPKPHIERCKKTILSVSDLVMRKCRIVLRQAASEDDDKVFCNLLGRNLTSHTENDDEGLLGSPAMVSRPLDFRTIDFRLAAGAYGGSPEAFLEDVREDDHNYQQPCILEKKNKSEKTGRFLQLLRLWSNVRTAHADQPDLVNLAETLSQSFESLYEREVVSLLRKLEEYSDSDNVNAEVKKEIRDIMVSTAELPKAPWDEGVCKVCGIDKDDDSVLLCDTCDAEYHTYCLSPPLARIPEGNWYCPSCARSATKGSSKGTQVLVQRRGRKYHGEGIRKSLGELIRLASVMEEKEYWEFTTDERTLLLKILCDDLLNSVQIRQHLEQCAEMSSDLQQKLRSLYSEVKTLKVREDILASRAAKVGQNLPNVTVETGMEEGRVAVANSSLGMQLKPALSSKSMDAGSISIDVPLADGSGDKASVLNDLNGQLNNHLEKNSCSYDQVVKPAEASQPAHSDALGDNGAGSRNHTSHQMPLKCLDSSRPLESPTVYLPSQEIGIMDNKTSPQGELCEAKPKEVQGLPTSEDLQGVSLSSDPGSIQLTECVPSLAMSESHSFNLELNGVKNEISLLQQSIADAEAQLLKFSVRMEFLGGDSCGRLYWVSAKPGACPWVIADGTMALQRKRRKVDHRIVNAAALTGPSPSGTEGFLNMEGSSAPCPFVYKGEGTTPTCSQWVAYQSHAEILELVQWLKDNDPKERELKDSVMQWQKLRFHDSPRPGKQCQDEPLSQQSNSTQETDSLNCLLTKAYTVLEKKYGPCFEAAVVEYSKKPWKRGRVTNDKRMFRCKCLEPVWPSRNHCLSCHRTFLTALELEKHNDGGCGTAAAASERRKDSAEPSGGLTLPKSDTRPAVCTGDGDATEASISAGSELNSSLIKFQSEGIMCPYRFEEISSKFVTNDSIKELMQEIGLIASDGTPSFVPSVSTYLNDPALMLAHPQGGVSHGQSESNEKPTSLQAEYFGTKAYTGCVSDISFGRSTTNMLHEDSEADHWLSGSQDKKGKSTSLNGGSFSFETGQCCTVPAVSLRPLVGRAAQIMKRLKICLLDIEAALPEEALRLSRVHPERRWSWCAFVKAAKTIFEMIQAMIVLEDMIKTEYLRNEWWYWSSLSAAAKTSTLSALALRIYSLDNAIVYVKAPDQNLSDNVKDGGSDQHPLPNLESSEKSRLGRRVNRKRKETDG
ncbi:hypothetical protein Ancab_023363 [Ancistrocladus abbreviatus]